MRAFFLALLLLPGVAAAELRVAVMEFTNESPDKDLDSLGKGLQSMITTDLAQVGQFKLVERARLADLQAELKLGKSGAVDKATAAKVGKLAGATHLVAGTFTVVGATMRIDGRLFAVQGGDVLLAEKIEGEKDAFFELEKALVKKIIDASGVKLAPKERGEVAKLHTTDYEAFKSFSQGVAAFDEKKYDEAIAALRAAQSKDSEFKLAEVTLSEYQQIIARLRSKADEIQTTTVELENLARQKGAKEETETIARLYGIAKGKDPIDRLVALYMLAVAYGNVGSEPRDRMKLQGLEDRFALQRTADALAQSYFAEAVPLFPQLPVVIRDQFNVQLPQEGETFEKAFARAKQDLLDYRPYNCPPVKTREQAILCNLQWTGLRDDPMHELPQRLRLDGRQTVELHKTLFDLGVKVGASEEWRHKRLAELAHEWRNVGEIDKSTATWNALAGMLKDADKVREVADQIEVNKAIAEALARSPQKALLRELLVAGKVGRNDGRDARDQIARHAAEKTPSDALWKELGGMRELPSSDRWGGGHHDQAVFIGDLPVWKLQSGSFAVSTGRRTDRYRAESLRYYEERAEDAKDNVFIIEGVPRKDVKVSFELVLEAPPEFRTVRGDKSTLRGARPEVGLMFGARDIAVDLLPDPKTGNKVLVRPMKARVLMLRPDAVEMLDVVEVERGVNGDAGVLRDPKRFEKKSVEKQGTDARAAKLAVSVEVSGGSAKVTVNGKTSTLKAPAERTGFFGLWLGGVGYVEVRGLKIK